MIIFSIVVCTYNRASQLKTLLNTLVEQKLPIDLYEVLIVDNHSTDETSDIAKGYCTIHKNWRYIFEGKQGLSNARNRGWQEAGGEYVVYTDDDCKVPPEWLLNAKIIAEEISPGMFGGPYYPFYQSPKPGWIKDIYFSKSIGDSAHVLHAGEYLSGGNFFIKKRLIEKIGGFSTELGMVGAVLRIGEETALQNWVHKNLPEEVIFGDPSIYVYHLVPEYKMHLSYRAKRFFIQGVDRNKISLRKHNQSASELPSLIYSSMLLFLYFIRFLISLTIQTMFRDRKKYPNFRNYWFERSFIFFERLGQSWSQWSTIFKRRNYQND